MKNNYPSQHQAIVTSFLEGKFITIDDKHFEIVKKNEKFYVHFFEQSFGFELKSSLEFYHLISKETNENTSRDISIFLSVLCYELDKDGRNFLEELSFSEFNLAEVLAYFKNSSWSDIINENKQLNQDTKVERLIYSTMVKRNIVVKVSKERFRFTKAYKFFIEFVRDLVKSEGKKISTEEE